MERCFNLVFLLEGDLVIALIAIKEGKDAAGCRVDDLVDAWEAEGILRVVLVEICVIKTHTPFIVVFLEDEDRIRQPLGVIDFFDESSRE